MHLEERVAEILKKEGIKLVAGLPCEKMKNLFEHFERGFDYVPVSREEEGVGISAGAYLAGAKSVIAVQSSGVGNMINALCSLTLTYRFPLPLLISWRGTENEKIAAQVPLGKSLQKILEAIGAEFTLIKKEGDIEKISEVIETAYEKNIIHAALISPKIWKNKDNARRRLTQRKKRNFKVDIKPKKPELTRYEILKAASEKIEDFAVICTLGMPSKELFSIRHRSGNFYMLGSMGMASSVALGAALCTKKKVLAIEGDGSILMNPSSLATIAIKSPQNLCILAVDNASYATTGGQASAAFFGADLQSLAAAMGIENSLKVSTENEIHKALEMTKKSAKMPMFIHAVAKEGNADVKEVNLTAEEIKKGFMGYLKDDV